MAYTKAGMKAVSKYMKANYDSFLVRVPKGRKRLIEAFAKEQGQSVNGLINEFLRAPVGLTSEAWAAADKEQKPEE